MGSNGKTPRTKILILASLSGGYRGADSVGQLHTDYPSNTYILPVVSAAMFPENFYLNAFEKGIDAILVMFSGTDSPYKGSAEKTAEIINRTYALMKERGIDTRRLVCAWWRYARSAQPRSYGRSRRPRPYWRRSALFPPSFPDYRGRNPNQSLPSFPDRQDPEGPARGPERDWPVGDEQ